MSVKMIKILTIFISLIKISLLQELGEKCSLNDKTTGYCTHAFHCSTISLNWYNTIEYNFCNTRSSSLIVCCPFSRRRNISKSAQKCLEYSQIALHNRYVRNIAGGYRALPGEFAHVAALGYINKKKITWQCGGTLISDQYVLTAAHCLKSREFGLVKIVRLGDIDLDSDDDMVHPQNFKVQELIPHQNFKRKNRLNDIGLIKLNKKVKFGIHVFPVCLYPEKQIAYNKLTAIGWGPSQFGSDKSNSLMKTDLDVFEDDDCRNSYIPYNYRISSDTQFCAVGTKSLMDTCQGDSGGPLLAPSKYNKRIHNAVGIVSFGPKCGMINKPGVYTKISYYISWIERIVWP